MRNSKYTNIKAVHVNDIDEPNKNKNKKKWYYGLDVMVTSIQKSLNEAPVLNETHKLYSIL